MRLLSDAELTRLVPAETHAFPGPIPTEIVSSDEYRRPTAAADRRYRRLRGGAGGTGTVLAMLD